MSTITFSSSNTEDMELNVQKRASRTSSQENEIANSLRLTSNDRDQHRALSRRGTTIFTRWWQDDPNLDDLERYLQSHSRSDAGSRRLLQAYSRLKTQPGDLLFNSLLAFRICGSEDVPLSGYEHFEVEEGTPFTSCLSILKNYLQKSPPPTLQIWYVLLLVMKDTGSKSDPLAHSALTNDIPDSFRFSGYSFVSKIFASSKTLGLTHEVPLQAILRVIQQERKLSSEAVIDCDAVPKLQKPGRINLPSSRKLFVP